MVGVAAVADQAQDARRGTQAEHASAEQQRAIELRGCAHTRRVVLILWVPVLILRQAVLVLGLRMGD